jgi:hypothetical protein
MCEHIETEEEMKKTNETKEKTKKKLFISVQR